MSYERTEEFNDDGDVYLDPNDVMEVIDIDENDDMDEVADRLMDIMDDSNGDSKIDTEESIEDEPINEEIIEPGDDLESTMSFSGHNGSVFSCALSSCGKIAATGGEDDKAYMWRTEDGAMLLECTDFKDSVAFVKFSEDDKYLATADMSGIVKVWSVKSSKLVWSREIDDEITVMLWFKHVLVCGNKVGQLWVWRIPKEEMKLFLGDCSAVKCAAITKDGRYLIAGYENGSITCFEIRSEKKYVMNKRSWHSDEVITLDTHADSKVFISGSVDGTVKLHVIPEENSPDKLVYTDSAPQETSDNPSIESLKFCTSHKNLAVSGTLSGMITIYDINNSSIRYKLQFPEGVSNVIMSPVEPVAYFSCLDKYIRVVNLLSGKQTQRLTGHSNAVLDIASDRSGKVILSSSDDGSARIYSIQ